MNIYEPVLVHFNHEEKDKQQLEKEMNYVSERLKEMGDSGDCAYERAMSKVYHALLESHQSQLQSMR